MLAFPDRLEAAVRRCGNPVLVGLDPRRHAAGRPRPRGAPGQPEGRGGGLRPVLPRGGRCRRPARAGGQAAGGLLRAARSPGMAALAEVVAYARRHGLLVILDGKRNDIGSTAAAYARAILGQSSAWGADALTVSPYLGDDSLQPFVDVAVQRAAGIFVLVKTSNPGGRMFQDLIIDKGPGDAAGGAGVSPSDGPGLPSQLSTLNSRLSAQPLYRHVAAYVEALAAQTAGACGYGAVGAVVGATYPAQLADFAPPCRTRGSSFPVMGPRAARRPTSPRPSTPAAAGRSSTTPAASSLPTSVRPTRSGLGRRVGKRPLRRRRGR